MPEFTCRIGTPTGEVVTRVVEAEARDELRKRLEHEGFRIFSIEQVGSKLGFVSLSSQGGVKIEDFFLFNQQFATLLRAGLPMLQSLSVLIRRMAPGAFRTVLEDIERRLKNGAALSEALTAHPKVFPKLYTASILAGERSGELDKVLARYVNHAKALTELRRKLKKTLTYPALLVSASIILTGVLTTFVIPKFASLYDSTGQKLPAVTLYVVGISKFVEANLYWLGPALIIAVIGFVVWKRTEQGARAIDALILKLPLAGEIIRQLTTSRLTRSMATLLAGGLTVIESVEISAEVVGNRVLAETMPKIARQIREGTSLTDAMEQAGWFPPMAMDMIGVGERSGSLGTMLDEVASFYDAELDVKLSSLTTYIEPIVLVFMAGVVLTVLLALYLPILQFISDKQAAQ